MKNNTQTQSGFVYILSNESMPGLVKIGFTTRDPRDRAIELQSTGVPTPFKVEFVAISDYAYDIEQQLHENLTDYRMQNREFFKIDVRDAIQRLIDHLGIEILTIREEYRIEDVDIHHYSQLASVPPEEVRFLIEGITRDEWQLLEERRFMKAQREKHDRESRNLESEVV